MNEEGTKLEMTFTEWREDRETAFRAGVLLGMFLGATSFGAALFIGAWLL